MRKGARPRRPTGGRLLVVATPLGNLSDITGRAAEALRNADLVVCEDTRRSRKLLAHLSASTPLRSHHKFNEAATVASLLKLLEEGRCLALVSDAGTPGLSDPGGRLVKAARRHGHTVEAVPGPSAPAAALSVGGMEAPGYHFAGYPPPRAASRRRFYGALRAMEAARAQADSGSEPWPLVLFEAPHRLEASLGDMLELLGDRPAVLCREMTKLHEETVAGSLSEILGAMKGRRVRGEITIVVEGRGRGEPPEVDPAGLRKLYRVLEREAGRKEALREMARRTGLSRRVLYEVLFLERPPAGED